MQPFFSLIIPFYNAIDTIEDTLSSIQSQTFQDFEIYIINDGSKSIAGLDAILDKFSTLNIILISKENGGVSSARNLGASKAQGQFVLFLDSDDLIAPTFLEKIYQATLSDPTIDIVGTHMQVFGNECRKQKIFFHSLKELLIKNTLCYCLAIRSEKFKQFGPFDTELKVAEDWDLWISLIKNGCKIHIIDEYLFNYRKLSCNSLSGQMNKNHQLRYNSWNRIYQKHALTYQDFYSNNVLRIIKESNEHQKKNCNQLRTLKTLSVINVAILLIISIISETPLDDTIFEYIVIFMAVVLFIFTFTRIARLQVKNTCINFFSPE